MEELVNVAETYILPQSNAKPVIIIGAGECMFVFDREA